MLEQRAQVLVVGGGLGGVAAALAAAQRGMDVLLSESTDWLGGILTSQAVPPDEHSWIEQFGCTASYRALRDGIRDYYRAHYPLTLAARARRMLNPGAGRVTWLCHEPRVALAVLESMLAPHRSAGRVRVLLGHTPVAADTNGDRIKAVTLHDATGDAVTLTADWFVDATETGDLLPLCGAEYVTGAESREQTGEPHAPAQAQPLNMQPVSVCYALDHLDGEDHTIERPAGYERFRQAKALDWPEGQLSFLVPDPKTREPVPRVLRPNPAGDPGRIGPDYTDPELDKDLWLYRRIAARGNFVPGAYRSDITLVNWPQMDYWGGPVYEVPAAEAQAHLAMARQLSLSLLYWLQTEAPRPDGGAGWPGLRLRADVVGDTADGLAKAAYVRESRRIRAEYTVVEQDIALHVRGEHGAVSYLDTVGIGCYRIDLHPSTGGDSYIDIGCCPYQLPLGALVPVRLDNLLAGGKNVGTTHVTNGTYRMPPVEWNAGEVAAHLAAFCTEHRVPPRAVRARPALLEAFQTELTDTGVELHWPRIAGY
jgi:hypothetical protein